MLCVVVSGLALLVSMAVIIGNLVAREARDAAWNRIATARRINAETAEVNRATAEAHRERAVELEMEAELLASRERRLDFAEQLQVEREAVTADVEQRLLGRQQHGDASIGEV